MWSNPVTEAAKQVPALIGVIFLVIMFGKHLDKRDARHEALQQATNEVLKEAIIVMDRVERKFDLEVKAAGKVAILAEQIEAAGG